MPSLQKRCFRFAQMTAIAVMAITGPARAEDPCAYDFPSDSNPTPVTSEDVCNFHQVDTQLYRGGRPRPSAYPKLVGIGIRTIVNLEEQEFGEVEKAAIDELNLGLAPDNQIRYISIPIGPVEIEEAGVSHERVRELFGKFQDAKKPIFLHCYHGKDRTGAIVALYRLLMNQKSLPEAYEEAFHYRFSKRDHGLSRTIDRYQSAKKLKSLPRPEPAK